MDKLTAIKIKYDDGTYSDEIPVSVLSENVEWDSTHTLVDVLGSIDVDVTGTIQDQISQLFNEKVNASTFNNLVTRVDNIIASSGDDNTEIVDLRMGYDGTTYSNAGNAIRTQINNINNCIIAEWSQDNSYSIGDIVIRKGILYKARVNIPLGEVWTSGHWSSIQLINEEKTDFSLLIDQYNPQKSYSLGSYTIFNQQLYKSRFEISPEPWTQGHWILINKDAFNELNFNVQNDIENLYNSSTNFKPSKFIRGYITSSGSIASRSYAVVASNNVVFAKDTYIYCKEGFQGTLWLYPENAPAYSVGNLNGNIIPANTPANFFIQRSIIDTSESANIEEFVSALFHYESKKNKNIISYQSQNINIERYNNIEYNNILLDINQVLLHTSQEVAIDHDVHFKNCPFSIRWKNNSTQTSSEIRATLTKPFQLLGTQEIEVCLYIEDNADFISSIQFLTIESNLTKSISTNFINGWNKLRFSTQGAGNWLENANTNTIRFILNTTEPIEINIYIGSITIIKPLYANLIVIADGPYYTFYTEAYPALKALNVPVTWALDPALLASDEDIERQLINHSELELLTYDGISEFSFHSYDGTIMSSATAEQALKDTLNNIRFLRKNAIQPNHIWRAAWLQNSCADPSLANLELDASASYNGKSGITLYPFVDKYNIPRLGMHGRTTEYVDSLFEKLRKTHCTLFLYTHGISETTDKELTHTMLNYFLAKIETGINDGWLNPTTYNRLVQKYSKIN